MALTKTLKFDEQTLNVIRRMQWSDTGLTAVIHETLDRALYEKVNKALTAMGGKWSRSIKAHVFKTDPRPQVEGLLEAGSLTVERDGFFETPRAVVERMLELAPMPEYRAHILEPSAGMGAILEVLMSQKFATERNSFYFCEKNDQRADHIKKNFDAERVGKDFMKLEAFDPIEQEVRYYDRIYMNPPFEEGQDIDHVQHAYDLLADSGDAALVAVMSEGPFFRADRKATEFREWLEDVGGISEPLPAGSFKESGTGVNTRLVLIKK